MSLLGSIGSTIASGVSSALGINKYRDSTLYDYSAVVRAKFYVFDFANNILGAIKETLPVQINPNQLSVIRKSPNKLNIEKAALGGYHGGNDNEDSDRLGLPLEFNVVDEYNARTMNGTIPLDISVDELTIINALYKYSSSSFRALFQWGAFQFFGKIVRVSCDYDAFSPYGEPLAGKANVELVKDKSGYESSAINNVTVKAEKTGSSAVVASQLIAAEAATELLPSVMSRIRG